MTFDGTGPWALAPVYEMAKALHLPVSARFGSRSGSELSRAIPTAGGVFESLTLDVRMPVWAITDQGLVAGTLRKASFGGDACSEGSEVPTAVELLLPAPVPGEIHGIFATNATLNPADALVTVRRRTFLDPLDRPQMETTFTHRVDVAVDVDHDGTADLRAVVSNDLSARAAPHGTFLPAAGGRSNGNFWRVAGWYAFDVYALQVNESGWWRTLSRYNLVTCT